MAHILLCTDRESGKIERMIATLNGAHEVEVVHWNNREVIRQQFSQTYDVIVVWADSDWVKHAFARLARLCDTKAKREETPIVVLQRKCPLSHKHLSVVHRLPGVGLTIGNVLHAQAAAKK
jgi:hypothetical protein